MSYTRFRAYAIRLMVTITDDREVLDLTASGTKSGVLSHDHRQNHQQKAPCPCYKDI